MSLRRVLRRVPYLRSLYRWAKVAPHALKQGVYPAGHFYSPIPDPADVEARLKLAAPMPEELPGIPLYPERQRDLLQHYAGYYKDLPFAEHPAPPLRYYYENDFFSYADAIFLYCFLRHHHPRRVVEIGSGFSSAVMLDTADRFLSPSPQFTFIEPYPERLNSLLRPEDSQRAKIIEKPLQHAPLDAIRELEAGDLLFIDSSHVVKFGSDVQLIFYEILPRLRPGVYVHFHDVFYPFEYPAHWLREGRYWNEDYFLRVFLYGNALWSIYFFNHFVWLRFRDFLQEHMPLCLRNPGGSLYLVRENAEWPPARKPS